MLFGVPNCTRMGQSAVVFTCGEPSLQAQRRLWGLARIARTWPHVRETVTGAGNLTLNFDRHAVSCDALAARLLETWERADAFVPPAHTIEIPLRYGGEDGPDLHDVARVCGLSSSEVIERHAASVYVVAFLGFVPGFGYLDGLDPKLHVPRRAQPRTRVPAGSVAIAGSQSAVYPLESPGGWQVIGRTLLRMFDPGREPFALLEPGDSVRFVRQ